MNYTIKTQRKTVDKSVYTFQKFQTFNQKRNLCHLRDNLINFAVITLTARNTPNS